MPALLVAGVGHSAGRPCAARSRRRGGGEPVRRGARLARAAPGPRREGGLGRPASGRPAGRLGVPIRQPALSRHRRHRRGGDGDGPRRSRRRDPGARRPFARDRAGARMDRGAAEQRTARGPPSTPTTPIIISITFRSPTMARCSTRRPRTSPRAASRCSLNSARRAETSPVLRAGSTPSRPIRRRMEAGSAAGA